jgi:hypothetical protein
LILKIKISLALDIKYDVFVSIVAVVEVQRLWSRFKQLGCDKKGYLQKKVIDSGELSQDVFMKNVIKTN